MLRFVICAVSPAVVIPLMIDLQDRKLGAVNKLPSLIIAATCIDNIIAITGHSLMIGITFNEGSSYQIKNQSYINLQLKSKILILLGELWWTLVQIPVQIISGVFYGIIVGYFLSIIRINHSVIF